MFLPSPGTLSTLAFAAEGNGLRIDSGVRQGDAITPYYDPMIAKLIAHGSERKVAAQRMAKALSETRLEGLVSNLAFLERCMGHPAFLAGETDTGFVEAHKQDLVE